MDLYQAIEDPRIHHQLLPNFVALENDQNVHLNTYLKEHGHKVNLLKSQKKKKGKK